MSEVPAYAPRTGKDLLAATYPFASEMRTQSWWHVFATLAILFVFLTTAAIAPWWPLRLLASMIGGLVLVRTFILYHDFMHGAILPGSRLAQMIFHAVGLLMLTPPRHWRSSHNCHHAHVGKVVEVVNDKFPVFTSDIGSFPLMSTDVWDRTTLWQRLRYRVSRHPVTVLCAYFTVFLLINCINPLLRDQRKHWDGALAIFCHGGAIALLWWFAGVDVALFVVVVPFAIASALGAYIFYAQHTYEGLQFFPPEEWTYYDGALASSSYMKLGPVLNWFTGNIGYHHVHHLNPHIPFYRLREAMVAIPELQNPTITSLSPRDVWACFRANLWEKSTQKMVSYGEASSNRSAPPAIIASRNRQTA